MAPQQLSGLEWNRDGYLISTSPSLVSRKTVNEMFASKDMHWARPMPQEALQEMIDASLNFGLYEDASTGGQGQSNMVGYGRIVTDFVSIAYLTDVYIVASHRGKGLGKWLIRCISEALDGMPHLRRTLLVTSDWDAGVPFYREKMGMQLVGTRKQGDRLDQGLAVMSRLGSGAVMNI